VEVIAVLAQRLVEARNGTGKIVLRPTPAG